MSDDFDDDFDLLSFIDEEVSSTSDVDTFKDLLKREMSKPEFSVEEVEFTDEKKFTVLKWKKERRPLIYVVEIEDEWIGFSTAADFMENIAFKGEESDFFPDYEDNFNNEFWVTPVDLYHGTPAHEAVLKQGLKPMSESRGLSNRSVGAAVFFSLSPEGTDSYAHDGEVIVADMKSMRDDYVSNGKQLPYVAPEPDILSGELLGSIAHKIGYDDFLHEEESGVDPDTIIVYGHVPAKYLSVYKGRR